VGAAHLLIAKHYVQFVMMKNQPKKLVLEQEAEHKEELRDIEEQMKCNQYQNQIQLKIANFSTF